MNNNFDYDGAKEAGYSDQEINSYLSSIKNTEKPSRVTVRDKNPNFDYEGALNSGYSMDEIDKYISNYKPKKSKINKAARITGQFGLGALEGSIPGMALDVAALPGASSSRAFNDIRHRIGDDVEDLYMKKYAGDWSEEDEKHLQDLQNQYKDTDKVMEDAKESTLDLSVRNLTEKATGVNLNQEGIAEKAAFWAGLIKNPYNLTNVLKTGVTKRDIISAIAPTGSEVLRGLGAGTALQMAEEGDLGPIGTMASAVIGDVGGAGISGIAKGAKNLITKPRETLAKTAAKFTNKDKLKLQQDLIKEFRETGIQADLGTITDSNLIKWTQSRISQSGLTGEALKEFSENLTNQIKKEYGELADNLGKYRFETLHEAGEVTKNVMKSIRDADLAETRNLYKSAHDSLKESSKVNPSKLASALNNLEHSLKPGSIKSAEQNSVLNVLDKLKKDIFNEKGQLKLASVKDLMNNKIALNDIINYEVQGGAKQLLKSLVGELDRAIISHGKENIPFVKNYIKANKKFSSHAKTFRNKQAIQMMDMADPSKIMDKMGSVQGIRNVEKILSKNHEGKELFDSLKRKKFDKMIGDNLIDSTSQQVKLGTFSKVLEKGKNKEIVKELMSPKDFSRFEKIQKNAGKLADAAQKFYNASKSGVVAADAAILVKGLTDIASLLMGNPWPLFKTSASIFSVKKLASLLADPEFLKMAEDIILKSKNANSKRFIDSIVKTKPYFLKALKEEKKEKD